MFRNNLRVLVLALGVAVPSLARESEIKVPPGFSLVGDTLTLPNKNPLPNVTGLQQFGRIVLIVGRDYVGLYNPGSKDTKDHYSTLLQLSEASPGDMELSLVPFDANGSTADKKADQHTAFIAAVATKSPNLLKGIYRFSLRGGVLQYLRASFGGEEYDYPGRFTSWYSYKSDRIGSSMANEIGINISERTGYIGFGIFAGTAFLTPIMASTPAGNEWRRQMRLAKEEERKGNPPKPFTTRAPTLAGTRE